MRKTRKLSKEKEPATVKAASAISERVFAHKLTRRIKQVRQGVLAIRNEEERAVLCRSGGVDSFRCTASAGCDFIECRDLAGNQVRQLQRGAMRRRP